MPGAGGGPSAGDSRVYGGPLAGGGARMGGRMVMPMGGPGGLHMPGGGLGGVGGAIASGSATATGECARGWLVARASPPPSLTPSTPTSAAPLGAPVSAAPPSGAPSGPGGGDKPAADAAALESIYPLVHQLTRPELREGALLDLSKKREEYPDLAPVLWHSFGTISALLQEIVGIYPSLSPPTLSAHASNRVCNALALLQCVASHAETRALFLQAHIPLFLYPFLNTVSKNRPFEYLRLTSLGVIGALVKMDDSEVVNFLLQTEIIPLCLRIMESGSELSKTVATFIVQKILLDDNGLNYICHTAERFYAVSTVLSNMVAIMAEHPSHRLLKHIVRCYLRLADNPRAREALRTCLPNELRDNTFAMVLQGDPNTKRWLANLSVQLSAPADPGAPAGGATLSGGS